MGIGATTTTAQISALVLAVTTRSSDFAFLRGNTHGIERIGGAPGGEDSVGVIHTVLTANDTMPELAGHISMSIGLVTTVTGDIEIARMSIKADVAVLPPRIRAGNRGGLFRKHVLHGSFGSACKFCVAVVSSGSNKWLRRNEYENLAADKRAAHNDSA